ncbi:MAG: hypothetical protein LBV41_04665 [Cytophagaceae bacterium]|jgi:nucleoside phosphorylase|nr:hypothetical protein [Cytophagaceae bacterium]
MIYFIMAMEAEARPFIKRLQLSEDLMFNLRLPMRRLKGKYCGIDISVIINGKDKKFNLDLIGTQAATIATQQAIERQYPNLIISAGTAGAFAGKGADVGDIYLSYPHVAFHDRRVPISGWNEMGIGSFPVYDTRKMAQELGFKLGIVTTGDSLDMSPTDAAMIETIGGEVKDMEAAAVAWVASLYQIPMFCIKSVTDLVDSTHHATHEQFARNLETSVEKLTDAMITVVEYLAKHSSDYC